MPLRLRVLLNLCAALFALPSAAMDHAVYNYPETRRDAVVEPQFGEQIADPYRWLENDVRTDPAVAEWVARQNDTSRAYLEKLPARDWFEKGLRRLTDYERFGLPKKAGRSYFYTRNSGLQNQAQLFVRRGLTGTPRLLLDPNAWAKDSATALDAWEPSKNGRHLAYSVQDGGTDWRIIRVLDVRTGQPLPDEVRWAKFTNIAWIGNEGFLYSRFPEPKAGEAFQQTNADHAVYFHRLGTAQSADELVYSTPDHPKYNHVAEVTHDGRWAIITTSEGTDNKYEVHAIRLNGQPWTVRTLVKGLDYDWRLIDGIGDRFFFMTNKDAPKLKVVKASGQETGAACEAAVTAPSSVTCYSVYEWNFTDLIPERAETLDRAQIVGDRLILSYLKDAASTAEMLTLDGTPAQAISLSAIGTASGFSGQPGDPETFYSFTSFNQPSAVYRFDSRTGQSTPFAQPALTFDPAAYAIEQRFFASKDGTRIPMFLVRRKDVVAAKRAVPTLMYGYGGFDISLTPGFAPARMAWLEAGGAYAMVNLRGGGEYGKAWHDAGRRANKQNVFDDFIAAGEYLKREGITTQHGLAIEGRSNGGLLMGAVANQRPDLFDAVHAAVGVMDMLRFDRFTAGRYWVDDYGYPDREADWRVLRSYSPYHNIRSGTAYPAILVSTADTDDRVVPGHSFKYAAALQAADLGQKPHLIRIETRAGHGTGKPTDKVIEESADVLAFLAQWSGLRPAAQEQ